MKKRDEELIKKIHEVEFDILEKFVDVCKKLGLRYSLSSGTLLGAVRHKGFIPWDDDIDVAMPREDYDKFIKMAGEYLPEGYELQYYENCKYAQNPFAKIRRSNTAWIYASDIRKATNNLGFSIDVFPINRVESPKKLKSLRIKTKILIVLRGACSIKTIHKSKMRKFIAILLWPIAKMIGLKRLNRMQDRLEIKYNKGDFTYADMSKKHAIMPYSIFEEYSTIEFEGKKFSCIKDYKTYLERSYGSDYMKLPPENKRVIHLPEIIDCEQSYLNYLKTSKKSDD